MSGCHRFGPGPAAARRVFGQALVVVSLAVPALCGCEDEPITSGAKPAAAAKAAKGGKAGKKAKGADGTDPDAPPVPTTPLPKIDFQEVEFAESDRSRDPFRTFTAMFVEEARSKLKSQREVVLDQYTVDELKLAGIVTRIVPPRAMLVDPTGKGHVVRRGQFVGRSELVQPGQGGAAYEINWRIDRIRPDDIVLVREDPQNPDVPSATRVIPLRPDGTLMAEN